MRYMPHTAEERAEMLKKIGVSSVDELFVDIPEEARLNDLLDLPTHAPEMVVEKKMQAYGLRTCRLPRFPHSWEQGLTVTMSQQSWIIWFSVPNF